MSLLSPPLLAFIHVAQKQSVHQAAKELHISQTAVTQRLRQLETRLNTSLFSRSRRGMQLTHEGEALLRYCYACRELEQETLQHLQYSGTAKTIQLKITGPTGVMSARIIPQCFTVMQHFPQLLLHFDISDDEHRDQKLREGKCQFAIITPEYLGAEMAHKKLQAEHYILVAPYQWRKRTLTDIVQQEPIIDYNPEDQMTFNYLKHYRLFKTSSLQRHFVNRTESMANMIAAGYGYGVITQEFARPYLQQKRLVVLNQEKTYPHQQCLAWYPRPTLPPYMAELIQQIK